MTQNHTGLVARKARFRYFCPLMGVVENDSSFVTRLALIASMSGLLFGYDTGVVSGAIIFIRSEMNFLEERPFLVEIIVASTILKSPRPRSHRS